MSCLHSRAVAGGQGFQTASGEGKQSLSAGLAAFWDVNTPTMANLQVACMMALNLELGRDRLYQVSPAGWSQIQPPPAPTPWEPRHVNGCHTQ